ncbi:hypothetical protein [Catenulispora sp. EB89]|uniref:hypothetical protein n=1 Tax=Catenulispora sp. EB89 TaxID=3156257 RepID=UPI003514C61E
MTGSAAGSSLHTFGALSRSAIRDFVPAETCWRTAELVGRSVEVAYRLNQQEHSRRLDAGLGSLCASDQLDMLLGLPSGLPVPVESLTARERRTLRRIPSGALERSGHLVQRHAVQPLMVDMVLVPVRGWRSGLQDAGRFAPFAMRMMSLTSAPSDVQSLVLEASYYGIGVLVADGDDQEVLVPPRPFIRRRHTAAGWQFVEQVYQQVQPQHL